MQPLIYQGKQLKLHQRATCLLELLKKAQSRQSSIETDLQKWRGATNRRTRIVVLPQLDQFFKLLERK